MTFLLLIAFLAVVGTTLAVPLFEFVFATLLLVPVGRYLLAWGLLQAGYEVPNNIVSTGLYVVSFGVVLGIVYKAFGRRAGKVRNSEWYPLAFFGFVFCLAYALCMQWPDFIDLGERLRDYSMLASSMDSPVVPKEPWMEGIKLNYYVYWYRFGNLLSSVLGMFPWEAYHTIISFSISLYAAVLFQLTRVVLRGGVGAASLAGIFIPFGANVAGMLCVKRAEKGFGWEPDNGWWGPSRVIQGAIDEFPAWSFVLGDAHPHFLNIAALPFFALILFRILSSSKNEAFRFGQAAAFVVAAALFLKASNAWEVPMWIGTVACVGVLGAFAMLSPKDFQARFRLDELSVFEKIKLVVGCAVLCAAFVVVWKFYDSNAPMKAWGVLFLGAGFVAMSFPFRILPEDLGQRVRKVPLSPMWVCFWGVLFVVLWNSGHHIIPPDEIPLRPVRQPTQVTTTAELFMHWGFQLGLLTLGSLLLLRLSAQTVLLACFLALSVKFDKAALFIYCVFALQIVRILDDKASGASANWGRVFEDAFIMSGLVLVLTPEFVFLDDSYGPEIDRMNTIFKFYTTAWGLLGLGAVSVIVRALRRFEPETSQYGLVVPMTCGVVIAMVLSYASYKFYAHTMPMRENGSLDPTFEAKLEGLGEANRWHPGSADVIRALRKLPRGRVLEAQGRAYSYTAFVSTLAAQPSYLGWANHINLLNKVYGESSRREGITREIYAESNCSARKQKAKEEQIRYIVVGTLERKAYPGAESKDYSCFAPVVKSGEYELYQIPL